MCIVPLFQLFGRAGKQKEQRPNGILTSLCQDDRDVQRRSHFSSTGSDPLTQAGQRSRITLDPGERVPNAALRQFRGSLVSAGMTDQGHGSTEPERQQEETRHESTRQSRTAPPPNGAAVVGKSA